jgi:hypothetical protein
VSGEGAGDDAGEWREPTEEDWERLLWAPVLADPPLASGWAEVRDLWTLDDLAAAHDFLLQRAEARERAAKEARQG